MTTGKKRKMYIIGVCGGACILLCLVIVYCALMMQEKEEKIEFTSVEYMQVVLAKEAQEVNIDFNKKEIYLPILKNSEEGEEIVDSELLFINEEQLKEYHKYLMAFQQQLTTQSFTKKNTSEEPYWEIRLTNQDGQHITISGTDAYPADWRIFIEKTNALIGEEHLTYDNHGLALY